MTNNKHKAFREEMIAQLEEMLPSKQNPEDDLFYYHPSEERIILSHAIFWVMTSSIGGKIAKQESLLLLRLYQEEMLEAWLTESPEFKELLHYCHVLYNGLPIIVRAFFSDPCLAKEAHKLASICIVAVGFGGDLPEDLANDLLDDINFYHNKVRCRKIGSLLPMLNQLVMEEQQNFGNL